MLKMKEFDLNNLTKEEKDLLTDWFNESIGDDSVLPWSPVKWEVDSFVEDGDWFMVCEIQGRFYMGSGWCSSEDREDIGFRSIREVSPYQKTVTAWKTV